MLAIQHLAPGTRLKLTDGGLAEIRENPRDGTWLIVRRLAPRSRAAEDELLIVDDIAEIVPAKHDRTHGAGTEQGGSHVGRRTFIAARDFLIESSHRLRARLSRVSLAGARPLQLGARLFRPDGPRQRPDGAVDRQRGRRRAEAELCRDLRNARTGSPIICAALGVRRGDRVLLMLGNVVPLWESMLAAMKLGAVVIPATTLLTRDDLIDRFERGRARHVITSADNTAKFAEIPGDYTRIAVGGTPQSRRDGIATRTPTRLRPSSRRTARRAPPTRCCCISPRARRRGRSWCCTAIRATRSAIWRRCTGSAWSRATCT